jgi:hypothetical protein
MSSSSSKRSIEEADAVAASSEAKRQRQPVNYAAITAEQATAMLNKTLNANRSTNALGCHLFGGSLNTDGYGQIQKNQANAAPGVPKKINYLGHIVALRSVNRNPPASKQEHASHLCHNRNCWNPDHIVVESVLTNNQRKGCPGDVRCHDCTKVAWTCPHAPKCLSQQALLTPSSSSAAAQ